MTQLSTCRQSAPYSIVPVAQLLEVPGTFIENKHWIVPRSIGLEVSGPKGSAALSGQRIVTVFGAGVAFERSSKMRQRETNKGNLGTRSTSPRHCCDKYGHSASSSLTLA